MAEKFFWADQIADEIIKEKGNKKQYICASGITPSGTIHIGNFREVITTDLVARALRNKGKNVRFLYSWDDYDRFRKVPKNVPEEYEKYVGMPLSEFISPFDKKLSYAEYFEKEFEESLKKVGINPDFIRQNVMNKKCKYTELIKTALEKKDDIVRILNKYRREPLKNDWWPIAIYCEECKKDSTKITSVKGYEIEYECLCGHKNKIDYRKKGIVSVKWRVDWPMRWKYENVDYEPGGIDHSVHGGSLTTSKEIVKEVFDYETPIYTFYDWVRIKGGKEFSSSSGNAVSLDDVEKVYEPEVLRYIFVSTRPNKGFQISFDNDIIKIYEDYDDLEHRYFEGIVNPQEKRVYELSQVSPEKIPEKKPERMSFRHLITLVQTEKTKELNLHSKKRAEKVKNWLEKHAGPDMTFEVQKEIKKELTDPEKQALIMLKESLATKKFNEEELFNEFYNICQATEIKPKEFFQTAYEILIDKPRGPRLASLILSIGEGNVVKLLEKIK
ncbi:MAG: lysine--tRNA ligase [Candidatus Pacearchaeota archaeon]